MPGVISHDGQAVPTETVSKTFTAWSIRMLSGARNFRYYYRGQSYYSGIFAVITLYTPLAGGAQAMAGELVFFPDSLAPSDLPIDMKDGPSGITLYYGRQDYDSVLSSLQSSSGGLVQWVYMNETAGDVSQQYITGQLLLNPK